MKNKKRSGGNTPPRLSHDELGMVKSRVRETGDRSQIPHPKKKKSKTLSFAKKHKMVTAALIILAVSIIAVAVLLCILAVKNIGNSKRDFRFTFVQFGKNDEEVKYKYESVMIDDVLYVDMNRIAEFGGMSVSGSADTMKYIASDEHYMKFTNESDYAVINANKVVIPAPAIVKENKCLVPYSVVSKAISSGISFKLDREKNTVTVNRDNYKEDGIVYNVAITFSHAAFSTVHAITDSEGVLFEYKTDVSGYLKSIDPADASEYLMLVNPKNPLSSSYVPDGMKKIPSKYTASGEEYSLCEHAATALIAMMKEMDVAVSGGGIYVTSAYRSYSYQANLFEIYVKEYINKGYSRAAAESKVLETSARPGESEHQSGLCVDFTTVDLNVLDNRFEQTRVFEWLSENAHKFGYVLRYPNGKKDVVFYNYESWHYRFVGRSAATEMYLSGLCLEEYLELI